MTIQATHLRASALAIALAAAFPVLAGASEVDVSANVLSYFSSGSAFQAASARAEEPNFREDVTFTEDWDAGVAAQKFYAGTKLGYMNEEHYDVDPQWEGETFYNPDEEERSVNNVTVQGARVDLGVFQPDPNDYVDYGNLTVEGTPGKRGVLGLHIRHEMDYFKKVPARSIESAITVGENATFIYSYAQGVDYVYYNVVKDHEQMYPGQWQQWWDYRYYTSQNQAFDHLEFTSLAETEARANQAMADADVRSSAAVFYTNAPLKISEGGKINVGASGDGVRFGSNSLFVIDRGIERNYWNTALYGTDASYPVFADSDAEIKVDSGAKLYVYGLTGDSVELILVSNDYKGTYTFWDAEDIYSDNPVLSFVYKEGSPNILVGTRTNPSVVFKGFMQSSAIMDKATEDMEEDETVQAVAYAVAAAAETATEQAQDTASEAASVDQEKPELPIKSYTRS